MNNALAIATVNLKINNLCIPYVYPEHEIKKKNPVPSLLIDDVALH
jgi:hypothetical protein